MAEFAETRTVNCPYCGNAKVVKNGRRSGYQRYLCKPCGKQFKHTGELHGRHAPTGRIGAAVRMFYSGLSYKQIGENLAERDDISEPSKQTIYAWVKRYTDDAVEAMQDYPAHVGDEWVADEMQVKVGGKNLWHWNIMDAKTRYVLATHLTPNRDTRAAVAVMRKAAQAADNPPKVIKSDKLGSYPPAIKEVFPDARHVQSDGIRALINNNLSERLQGTYRQRTKTLRGLDTIETGQRYLDGWTLTYNLFREHEGIDYDTPGERAKVKPPFTEWEDVVIQSAGPTDHPRTAERDATARMTDADRRNPRIVPDSTQRRRPKGETEADDEEWPRSDSDTDKVERARESLAKGRRDISSIRVSPKRTVLADVKIQGARQRRSPFAGKVAIEPPKGKERRRKGTGEKAAATSKPVLLLGR